MSQVTAFISKWLMRPDGTRPVPLLAKDGGDLFEARDDLNAMVQAAVEAATKDLETNNEALEQKLGAGCACSFERPDDRCKWHLDMIRAAVEAIIERAIEKLVETTKASCCHWETAEIVATLKGLLDV